MLYIIHKTDYDISINRRNTMQNFNLIIDFKIQNLQIQTIAKTQCLDIYFELFNITNPQNPISLFYDFQLSFTKSYQQNLKTKCPICLDNNIKKSFNII
ncbi:hypothetical protein SEA_EFFIE_30 [Acinetobacter phage Effie]|nr:hypothetical protein SEA_EFFIE_30 [Acinetobacter phage Effie]